MALKKIATDSAESAYNPIDMNTTALPVVQISERQNQYVHIRLPYRLQFTSPEKVLIFGYILFDML